MLVLKVLSYWNLNKVAKITTESRPVLKVLSYWNLNAGVVIKYKKIDMT